MKRKEIEELIERKIKRALMFDCPPVKEYGSYRLISYDELFTGILNHLKCGVLVIDVPSEKKIILKKRNP